MHLRPILLTVLSSVLAISAQAQAPKATYPGALIRVWHSATACCSNPQTGVFVSLSLRDSVVVVGVPDSITGRRVELALTTVQRVEQARKSTYALPGILLGGVAGGVLGFVAGSLAVSCDQPSSVIGALTDPCPLEDTLTKVSVTVLGALVGSVVGGVVGHRRVVTSWTPAELRP